jgi:hypothetical protein
VRRNETLKYGVEGITATERVGDSRRMCAVVLQARAFELPPLSSPRFARMCTSCSVPHSLPSSVMCETISCGTQTDLEKEH